METRAIAVRTQYSLHRWRGIAFQWHMETMAIAVRTQYSLYLGEGLHSSGGRTISGSDVTSSQLRTAGRDFSGGSRRGRHHPAPAPKRRNGLSHRRRTEALTSGS